MLVVLLKYRCIMKSLLKNISNLMVFIFVVAYPWNTAFMDASHPWQVGFQDPATPIMEGIIFFNGLLMTFMLFVACFVGWLLYQSLSLFDETVHTDPVSFNHSTLLEVVWTIIPAGILMVISVPSYNLLYAMEEVIDPSLTIKVVGHQWYWSYECSDFEVSPTVTKDYLTLAEDNFKSLKEWVDLIESSRLETGLGEKQTQVTLGRKAIKAIEKVMDSGLSKEAYEVLASRLEILGVELLTNEGRKEYYGPIDSHTKGEMVSILSEVKDQLSKSSLIQEQQDLVIKILKTFKQYLRISEEEELKATSIALFNSLEEIKAGEENSISKVIALGLNKALVEREKAEKILLMNSMLNECSDDNCEDSAGVLKEFLALSKSGLDDNPSDGVATTGKGENSGGSKGPNLELNRAQRESYSAEAELDRAKYESDTANVELHYAEAELGLALSNSKWALVDLAAAKVNQITAVYLKANADSAVTSPSLIRSRLLLEKGFDGWTNDLRVRTKEISEVAKVALINASEELKSAKTILRRALADLTEEESSKAIAIAGSAESEFIAVEGEVISVEDELGRAEEILKNAEEELKTFSAISDRAELRLDRVKLSFESAKALSNRAKSELGAAEVLFETAKSELVGLKSVEIKTDLDLNQAQSALDNSEGVYNRSKEEFYKAEAQFDKTQFELDKAEARLDTVKGYVKKTTEILDSTPLIYEEDTTPEEPISYYDNFLWEIHNRDLVVVEAQLKSAVAELSVAQIAFNEAKTNCNQVVEKLVEAELGRAKAIVDFIQVTQDNNKGSSNENMEFLFANSELHKAERYAADMTLKLADAIYDKALTRYKTSSNLEINSAQLVLDRAKEGLVEAKENSVNADLGFSIPTSSNKEWGVTYNLDSVDRTELHSDYAELCLNNIKEELDNAEADYSKALSTLSTTEELLGKIHRYISKIPATLDKDGLDKAWSLLKPTSDKFNENLAQFKSARASLSPLNIKLEPGLVGTKAYIEVLRSEAELANAKWLSFKVIDIVNNSMRNIIKPSDIMLSDSSGPDSVDTVENSGNSAVESDSAKRGSGDNKKESSIPVGGENKSPQEIKEILSKIDNREISYTQSHLFIEILQTFKDLVGTLDNKNADNVRNLLYEFLPSMIEEETTKNKSIKRHIDLIVDLLSESQESEEEETERQRINFDSYLIAEEDLIIPEASGTGKAGKVFRLLEVDNRLLVPTNTHIRVLVTSADVLHSWAVPSLGVKVDACPGRLNQVFLFIKREGVFYGQCSELCGVNHGFMPIVVQAVSQDDYLTWVGKRLCS
uniref:cytochrome-c oxidase n=1 Tax=Desmarestia viridis TaxID=62313 RepID=Q2TUE5_9PHAE|nr:cytochrome c oxidase subunit 2 [Desmarestia viridis]AAS79051.1 cytochrome oxidase subunit II [Desmarestia viridis]